MNNERKHRRKKNGLVKNKKGEGRREKWEEKKWTSKEGRGR